MSSAALLATLESTLRRIESLTPSGKPAWDADEVRQLAIERLWIAAGNLAEDLPRLLAQVHVARGA